MKPIAALFSLVLFFSLSGFTAKQKYPKNYAFVPSGTFTTDNKAVSVNAFFMSKHEVTNVQYRTFLTELKDNGNEELYKQACPDTTAWNIIGGYMTPMANMYFWHPAYDNYPVVNVSQKGMQLYCNSLTAELRKVYGDHINDVRLPSKQEWIYAASGNIKNAVYPWGGTYVRNAKGNFLANFRTIGDQNLSSTANGDIIVVDSLKTTDPAENYFITAPSESYSPNNFGLYNMSGNVAECTSNSVAMGGHWRSLGYDIRVTSEINFEKANPYVGFRPVISFVYKE